MADPYFTGPAALKIGAGPYLYSEEGFTVKIEDKTSPVMSDFHGSLGEFLISRKATISGRVVGAISSGILAALFPTGVGNVGASIFTGTDVPVVLWTKAGQKITWARGGVSKFPELLFAAGKSIYSGDLEVTCLGALTTSDETDPEDAAHWNAITSVAFADASFDETLITRDRFTAAYGDSPFDAMTAQAGFKVTINQAVEELEDDNVGIGNIYVKEITAMCGFIPSNLSEANLHVLLQLQNTGALQPGMLINGGGANDLVLSGSGGFSLTLSKPGFKNGSLLYASGKNRAGEITAVASRTFTTGVADPLFTFAEG